MELAFLLDGEGWAPSSLCPTLEFGFLYRYTIDPKAENGMRLHFKQLDGGGKSMMLPETSVKWNRELETLSQGVQ